MPSGDIISSFPGNVIFEDSLKVLMRFGENRGYNTYMLLRATMRLSELNALPASTRITASVLWS